MPNEQNNVPTPEQICAECARIREGWSEVEFYTRAGLNVPAHLLGRKERASTGVAQWRPPRMAVSEAEVC